MVDSEKRVVVAVRLRPSTVEAFAAIREDDGSQPADRSAAVRAVLRRAQRTCKHRGVSGPSYNTDGICWQCGARRA